MNRSEIQAWLKRHFRFRLRMHEGNPSIHELRLLRHCERPKGSAAISL